MTLQLGESQPRSTARSRARCFSQGSQRTWSFASSYRTYALTTRGSHCLGRSRAEKRWSQKPSGLPVQLYAKRWLTHRSFRLSAPARRVLRLRHRHRGSPLALATTTPADTRAMGMTLLIRPACARVSPNRGGRPSQTPHGPHAHLHLLPRGPVVLQALMRHSTRQLERHRRVHLSQPWRCNHRGSLSRQCVWLIARSQYARIRLLLRRQCSLHQLSRDTPLW